MALTSRDAPTNRGMGSRVPGRYLQGHDEGLAMGAARILVADDHPGIRAMLGEALAAFGYTTVMVGDGAAALGAARGTGA